MNYVFSKALAAKNSSRATTREQKYIYYTYEFIELFTTASHAAYETEIVWNNTRVEDFARHKTNDQGTDSYMSLIPTHAR